MQNKNTNQDDNAKYFELVTQHVRKLYGENHVDHFERTVYWIKQLKPNADAALLIAGYSHDIQRVLAPVDEGMQFIKGRQLKHH